MCGQLWPIPGPVALSAGAPGAAWQSGGMQSVYEAAGGSEGLLRLAEAWHARVMADGVVSHAFSHGFHPQHSQRLAAYWAEALGGPAAYSGACGDHTSVVRMHSGNGPHEEMDRRAIECFDQAMQDAGPGKGRASPAGPARLLRLGHHDGNVPLPRVCRRGSRGHEHSAMVVERTTGLSQPPCTRHEITSLGNGPSQSLRVAKANHTHGGIMPVILVKWIMACSGSGVLRWRRWCRGARRSGPS